ncbi:uncharacterized protein PG986_011082 [Apiospora aurea]|uniref:Tyrosinase copper-binding domain-containing protein n=1 Tax=Apiospora aurea TaxID=335848 RepID=A0ABR1Q436_9PEZI
MQDVNSRWRTLTTGERRGFIGAVRCLQSKPGQTSDTFEGVRSRYDDFVALHITQTDYVHWVGQLLPWHRYYLWSFEQNLREMCGYKGAVPTDSPYVRTDWTQDAVSEEAVVESPIFDPVHGFGGNGPYIVNTTGFPQDWQTMTPVPNRTGGGCIEDGPFAHVNISMGPGNHTGYTPHCLRRELSPWLITQALNASKLAFVLEAEDFWHLDHRIEGFSLEIQDISLHGGAHLGVGGNIGEMANTYSSPWRPDLLAAPLGSRPSLEHMAKARSKDWETRKSDIGGRTPREPADQTWWAYPYNYFGDIPYKNVTLETPLHFEQIGGTLKIRDTMDIHSGHFCYDYE